MPSYLGKLRDLKKQFDDLPRTTVPIEANVLKLESPFVEVIRQEQLPHKFQALLISMYDGNGDSAEHVQLYIDHVELHSHKDPIICRAFPLMFSGLARAWYEKLRPRLIRSFVKLSLSFALIL